MKLRGNPLAEVLKAARGRDGDVAPRVRRQSAAPAPTRRASTVDPATCTHLFESRRGGRCCRWCLTPAPGSRAGRGSRASKPRLCASEKTVQKACIDLYVAIGCRYSAKHETDIYVLGTRRPRNLPAIAHKTFQTAGVGDIWVFLPLVARFPKPGLLSPRFLWHEVKADDGHASPAQLRFQQQCLERGIAHVMGGVDEQQAFLVKHGFLKEAV